MCRMFHGSCGNMKIFTFVKRDKDQNRNGIECQNVW